MSETLNYSRILQVRAGAPSSNDLMALARERAPDESVFDEFAPVFFPGSISNTNFDAYETKMGRTTLQNYATEAAGGVAVCSGHDTRAVVGHSLTGRFVGAGAHGPARVDSEFFLLPIPEVASTVAQARAGVLRDLSVGFYGGQYLCSICGRDMAQWFMADGCPHFLGVTYPGAKEGDPTQVARATIEGAHLAEYSLVYDGACPDAMIAKMRALAAAGRMDEREREFLQVRHRLTLPERERAWPGADVAPSDADPETPAAETRDMDEAQAAEFERLFQERMDRYREQAKAAGCPEAADMLGWSLGELQRLRPLADDGATYRADLIESALNEGVRAYGNAFEREQEKADLEKAPLATIKRRMAQWQATAAPQFPGGRITTDQGSDPPTPTPDALPAGAYA